jgi:hypothetical protein
MSHLLNAEAKERLDAYVNRIAGPEPKGIWANFKWGLSREKATQEWCSLNGKEDRFGSLQKGMVVGAKIVEVVAPAVIGAAKTGSNLPSAPSYDPRIRAAAILENGQQHNFPYSFDSSILNSNPICQGDGSLLYALPGRLNSAQGFFTLAVNPNKNVIFHRVFVTKVIIK